MATRKTPVQADDEQADGALGVKATEAALSPAEESAFLLVRDGVHRAALEVGQPPEAFLFVLGRALRFNSPVEWATGSMRHLTDVRHVLPPDSDVFSDTVPMVENVRLIDDLIGRLGALKTTILEHAPVEASSTEVRKNWAEFLDRVRVNDESVYVTQHGKRVAALVPPHVAESYANEQAWFNTPEWQAKEREVDEARARGEKSTFFANDADFLAALETENAK